MEFVLIFQIFLEIKVSNVLHFKMVGAPCRQEHAGAELGISITMEQLYFKIWT